MSTQWKAIATIIAGMVFLGWVGSLNDNFSFAYALAMVLGTGAIIVLVQKGTTL